jgi:hypothetical protein
MAYTKQALIRDSTVAIGQPAPMRINCCCGQTIDIDSDANSCPCGAVYDSRGYVIQASAASRTEVASQYAF